MSLALEQSAKLSLTKAHSLGQHGLKSLFQIAGRTADDLEHLRSRGLLLERFAQLFEQPGVLDGDDGLSGKVADQFNLLVGEGADLLAINGDRTDQLVFL